MRRTAGGSGGRGGLGRRQLAGALRDASSPLPSPARTRGRRFPAADKDGRIAASSAVGADAETIAVDLVGETIVAAHGRSRASVTVVLVAGRLLHRSQERGVDCPRRHPCPPCGCDAWEGSGRSITRAAPPRAPRSSARPWSGVSQDGCRAWTVAGCSRFVSPRRRGRVRHRLARLRVHGIAGLSAESMQDPREPRRPCCGGPRCTARTGCSRGESAVSTTREN